MKSNNHVFKSIFKLGLVLVLVCTLLAVSLVAPTKNKVRAATEPAQTYVINSVDDMVAYAQAYAAGSRNPNDILDITITGGAEITDERYISIGTYDRPFSGEIIMPTSGVDTFSLNNCPLFNYVTTDLKVTGSGKIKIARMKYNGDAVAGALTSGALFANHVVPGVTASIGESTGITDVTVASGLFTNQINGAVAENYAFIYNGTNWTLNGNVVTLADYGLETKGTPATNDQISITRGATTADWYIISEQYSSSGNYSVAQNFDCLIKDIRDGLNVNVTFDNKANLNVSGTGNVGLICGTLGSGATLGINTVNTSATGGLTNISVTGNQYTGGLVGYMNNNAKLVFNSQNYSRVESVKSNRGYAAGIVGGAQNPTFTNGEGVTDYNVKPNGVSTYAIEGQTGAGGIIGEYVNTITTKTFSLYHTFNIESTMTLTATTAETGMAGGLFAYLKCINADANTPIAFTIDGNYSYDENNDNESVNISLVGDICGGLIGCYSTNSLKNTLNISNANIIISATAESNAAGLIGSLFNAADTDESLDAAYINISNVKVEATNAVEAGLIYNSGDKGPFIDVTDEIVVARNGNSGSFDAGLVYNMESGVLRIQGVTDLTNCKYVNASSGQIVKERNNALVYALGDGKGTKGNWSFRRGVSVNTALQDDIHSWGEVLRVDGTTLAESDLFSIDTTDHTVTIAAVSVSSSKVTIDNVTTFAQVALNMQLNGGDNGALLFAGNANGATNNKRESLATYTLELGNDISLADTGLTGLQRDNNTNIAFSGTFDGKGNTITMATGQVYGLYKNGNQYEEVLASSKQGYIVTHTHNGLFAQTNGATITNVEIAGTYNMLQSATDVYFGGLTATAQGKLEASGITASYTLNTLINGDHTGYYGQLIGYASGSSLDISITSSEIAPTIVDATPSGKTAKRYFAGVLAYLAASTSGSGQEFSITDTEVTFNYDGHLGTSSTTYFGGIIAYCANISYVKAKRTITIGTENATNDVKLSMTVQSISKNSTFGGILGTEWLSVDSYINSLQVTSTITGTGSTNNFGGLLQVATGYMKIDKINVSQASFNLPSDSAKTFGFIANKGWQNYTVENSTVPNVLYVDVNNENYNIGSVSFANGTVFSGYDELVYNTKFNNADIIANGNAVISITTSKVIGVPIIATSGDNKNTYVNKTAYGQTSGKDVNTNSRYYYNLEYARSNTATSKYNLLVYSVNTYAHSSIKSWFTYASTTFTGDLDMTGLSYYPVNISGATLTFSDANIKFDNDLMESYANVSATDLTNRTTRSLTNQHYLMHTGLFMNYVGTLNISNSTLAGNVPYISSNIVGFIVNGVFGNSDTANSKLNIDGLALNGCHIINTNGTNLTSTSTVAPLIINKMNKNTTALINNVSQSTTAYASYGASGYYAASSLIGHVGDSEARAIYLSFTNIVLDSRASSGPVGRMDAEYGTTKAIFSRATLLESFVYAGECFGAYSFGEDDDWADTNGGTQKHNVTYGIELTTHSEYSNNDGKYSNSTYYVDPETYHASSPFTFNANYLPYIKLSYSENDNRHELSINLSNDTTIDGVGKYGDPYIINDGSQLATIALIISGEIASGTKLNLPSDLGSYIYTNQEAADPDNVAAGEYTKTQYETTANGFNDTIYTNKQVREYLAGAYYVITKDIELDYEYISLGKGTDEYPPFRGVIVGRGITITNHSPNPLIYTSTGCVVKNLTVLVDVDDDTEEHLNTITLAKVTGDTAYNYKNGAKSYGAVIEQIMGGDTIIDGVSVTYKNVQFKFSGSGYERLVPIGGYVGTLFNGGLIFRNMNSTTNNLIYGKDDDPIIVNSSRKVTLYYSSSNNDLRTYISNEGWLYVNPYIGRVVAGYAFHEYSNTSEASTTLNNGTKNYAISNICLPTDDSTKLNVTYASSTMTIGIPNGDAWYVLGAIVNSGAGAAASYDASTEKDYDGLKVNSNEAYWQAYRADCVTRAGATYEDVGSGGATSADCTTYAVNDNCGSALNKVPYIIRAYTTKNGNGIYIARAICSGNVNINVSADCEIPSGFKGIGSIYLNNSKVRLTVVTFDGSNHKITMDMFFKEYNHKVVSKYRAAANDVNGFGLFNIINNSGATFKNLVLSGEVFYDVYNITTGNQSTYPITPYNSDNIDTGNVKSTTHDTANYDTNLAAGGLIGRIGNKTTIENVLFDKLKVEGAKEAGGLVGLIRTSKSTCNINFTKNTNSPGYVSCIGGFAAGGLIGRINYTNVTISSGTDADNSGANIYVKEIAQKSQTPNEGGLTWGANTMIGAGGLIGSCMSRTNQAFTLTITKINVKASTTGGSIAVLHESLDHPEYRNRAGGFVGTIQGKAVITVNITGCKIENVDISSNISGGIVGEVTQKYKLNFTDIEVISTNNSSISGTRFAGGVVGLSNCRDTFETKMDGVTVKGYNIISEYNGSGAYACGAGGVYGGVKGDGNSSFLDSATSNNPTEINNVNISNCVIETKYQSTNCQLVGTGGLAGLIAGGTIGTDTKYDINNWTDPTNTYLIMFGGYNILLENNDIKHIVNNERTDSTNNNAIGELVGNNLTNAPLRLVGVAIRYGDTRGYCGKLCGNFADSNEWFGSASEASGYGNGAVIFADYYGTSGNENPNTYRSDIEVYDYTVTLADSSTLTFSTIFTVEGGVYFGYDTDSGIENITLNNDGFYHIYLTSGAENKFKFNASTKAIQNRTNVQNGTKKITNITKNATVAFTNVAIKSPYVTVNPYTKVQNLGITGDAFVIKGEETSQEAISRLAISDIINSLSSGNASETAKMYQYAANSYYGSTQSSANKLINIMSEILKENSDKFSMFSDLVADGGVTYNGSDFPLLVVEDTASAQKYISSYIKMLTNSASDDYSYTADYAGIYSMAVYKVAFNGNAFSVSDFGASLKYDSEDGFYTTYGSVDTGKIQFSLVDVRFYKPSKSSNSSTLNTVYHLYIPVFVKKVLTYDFDIAAQSGTAYLPSNYESAFGDPFIENIGTPATLYFQYTYNRDLDKWNEAIVNGENLYRNYPKVLQMFKASATSEDLKLFKSDTLLALVDPNTHKTYYALLGNSNGTFVECASNDATVTLGNKYYRLATENDTNVTKYIIEMVLDENGTYVTCEHTNNALVATLGNKYYREATDGDTDVSKYSPIIIEGEGALSTDGKTLDLSKFREMVYVNGTFKIAGDYFKPINLCDLLDISVESGSGSFVQTLVEGEATISHTENGVTTYYRLAVDEDGDAPRFDITATYKDNAEALIEAYYLSIFTESTENYDLFHYYLITAPNSFNEDGYPSKMSDDSKNMIHFVMGKIFDHTGFSIVTTNTSEIMEMGNNALKISLSVDLGLNANLDLANKSHLKKMFKTTSVYQSFITYLERNDGSTPIKVILGNPTMSGSYTITSGQETIETVNYVDDDGPATRLGQSYAEFVSGDLKAYFADDLRFTISANVSLTYPNADSIASQFPGRDDYHQNNGVTVSGSSNLSFSQSGTSYAKNTMFKTDEANVTYYSKESPESAVLDLNPYGNKAGDFSDLAINPLNSSGMVSSTFELLGVLDTSKVSAAITGYTDMLVEVKLSQKVGDGYEPITDLSKYINFVTIGDLTLDWYVKINGIDNTNDKYRFANEYYRLATNEELADSSIQKYLFAVIPSSGLTNNNGAYVTINSRIRVEIKTGSELESDSLFYTNYRLTVGVALRKQVVEDYGATYKLYANDKSTIYRAATASEISNGSIAKYVVAEVDGVPTATKYDASIHGDNATLYVIEVTEEIASSRANNYIIYTNAKVSPDYIDR